MPRDLSPARSVFLAPGAPDYSETWSLMFRSIYGDDPVSLSKTRGAVGQVIAVGCRTTTGDGGGGVFYWDPLSTSTDDGGTVFAVPGVDIGRWRRIYDGTLDVRWFGAVGDAVTDCTSAIQSAIRALDAAAGGVVRLPFGDWRVASPIILDRPTILKGDGADLYETGTVIVPDAGVTPIIIASVSDVVHPSVGGGRSVVEGIHFRPRARDTSTVTCNYNKATHPNITISGAAGFRDGQIIRMGGCGIRTQLHRCTATVASGAGVNTFTLTSVDSNGFAGLQTQTGDKPAWGGMWVQIDGAWTTPVMVTAIGGLGVGTATITVNRNTDVTTGVTGAVVHYVDDHFARIRSGSATVAWVLDTNNTSGTSNPNAIIYHGDCGVYMRAPAIVDRCSFGNTNLATTDFAGCGVLVMSSVGSVPLSNANGWGIGSIVSYGNHHAVKIEGSDSNAGAAFGVIDCNNTRSWGVVDVSDLGNAYTSVHTQGGAGVLTWNLALNKSSFLRVYGEGGTICHYGDATFVANGEGAPDQGGTTHTGGVWNRLKVGTIENTLAFVCATEMTPANNWRRLKFVDTVNNSPHDGGYIDERRSSLSQDGETGLYILGHSDDHKHPVAITDNATGYDMGRGVGGQLVFGQGFWWGEDHANRELDAAFARHWRMTTISPATLGLISHRGQANWYANPVPGGNLGYICTTAGTTGTHHPIAAIENRSYLVKSVAGSSDVTLTADEASRPRIKFTGALTGNINVTIQTPAVLFSSLAVDMAPDAWTKTLWNATSGAFTLTVRATALDAGVVVPAGERKILDSDGVNVAATT